MTARLIVLMSLVLLLTPALAQADADVTQLFCEQATEGSNDLLLVHFSLTNFSLPTPICDLHFLPEPQPVLPECEFQEITPATGWSGFLNPFGGADFFANTPLDCVAPGQTKGGFSVVITKPGACCYIVQYTDPTGAVILEEEVCFDCSIIDNEEMSWGAIKGMFR